MAADNNSSAVFRGPPFSPPVSFMEARKRGAFLQEMNVFVVMTSPRMLSPSLVNHPRTTKRRTKNKNINNETSALAVFKNINFES